jgi:hypothetical protein
MIWRQRVNDTVGEFDAGDDPWQLIVALQPAPEFCGAHDELEDRSGKKLGVRTFR